MSNQSNNHNTGPTGKAGLLCHVGRHLDPDKNKRAEKVNRMIDEYNRTVHSMPPHEQSIYQDRVLFLRDRMVADIEPGNIVSQEQYEEYLEWVDTLLDAKVSPSSPLGDKVKTALLMIKKYEDEHYPIRPVGRR